MKCFGHNMAMDIGGLKSSNEINNTVNCICEHGSDILYGTKDCTSETFLEVNEQDSILGCHENVDINNNCCEHQETTDPYEDYVSYSDEESLDANFIYPEDFLDDIELIIDLYILLEKTRWLLHVVLW